MKSRHTPMSGKLTRHFFTEENEDLVVELNAEGYVVFRREPNDRKLKRGEQLPEFRVNVIEACSNLSAPAAEESDVAAILEKIAAKVPIASFEDETPAKAAYKMKVWLLDELKKTISDNRT